jgi:tungstate transport system permease protein
MDDIGSAFAEAASMIAGANATLYGIVLLSLQVSLTAVALATVIGLPLGAALAIRRFAGRQVLLVTLNALMGLPPVVVGLVVYLLLSRAGPLGELGLLFTPAAMVIAQAILVTPIIAGLSRQVLEDAWHEYESSAATSTASRAS